MYEHRADRKGKLPFTAAAAQRSMHPHGMPLDGLALTFVVRSKPTQCRHIGPPDQIIVSKWANAAFSPQNSGPERANLSLNSL
jgi:hypothetical protein